MSRVRITPIKSKFCDIEPFEIEGTLTSQYFSDCGLFYYINGQSFPANVVTILSEEAEVGLNV